jgi:ubiquinone/menaquinone biosynthesis C-methylase UbiE
MTEIHPAALLGFSEAALSYTRGRPEYPSDILDWLREKVGIYPGQTVVDLAAGTGKFTKSLLKTGANVIAVEPVDAMRAQLARSLPGVPAIAGTAQAIPLDDGSADAIVSAQAFHWFATSEALTEIHRVLKPGGKLGLVWNMPDDRVGWVAAIEEIIKPYEVDAPRLFRKGKWRLVFPDARFSDLEESEFSHQHVGPAQQVIIERALSLSFIATLQASEKAKVAARLRTLIATHPELKDRPDIALPYRTFAYCCVRRSP